MSNRRARGSRRAATRRARGGTTREARGGTTRGARPLRRADNRRRRRNPRVRREPFVDFCRQVGRNLNLSGRIPPLRPPASHRRSSRPNKIPGNHICSISQTVSGLPASRLTVLISSNFCQASAKSRHCSRLIRRETARSPAERQTSDSPAQSRRPARPACVQPRPSGSAQPYRRNPAGPHPQVHHESSARRRSSSSRSMAPMRIWASEPSLLMNTEVGNAPTLR